jgi:hypothetical protein
MADSAASSPMWRGDMRKQCRSRSAQAEMTIPRARDKEALCGLLALASSCERLDYVASEPDDAGFDSVVLSFCLASCESEPDEAAFSVSRLRLDVP